MNKCITQFELLNNLVNNLHKFQVTPTSKLVLLYLGKCWNPDKGYMFPRINTISRRVGISKSSVHRAIKELCKQGLIFYDTKSREKFVFTQVVFEICHIEQKISQIEPQKTVNLTHTCHEQRTYKQKKKQNYFNKTTSIYPVDSINRTQTLLQEYKSIKTGSPLQMTRDQAIEYLNNLPPQLLRTRMNQKLIKKFML